MKEANNKEANIQIKKYLRYCSLARLTDREYNRELNFNRVVRKEVSDQAIVNEAFTLHSQVCQLCKKGILFNATSYRKHSFAFLLCASTVLLALL